MISLSVYSKLHRFTLNELQSNDTSSHCNVKQQQRPPTQLKSEVQMRVVWIFVFPSLPQSCRASSRSPQVLHCPTKVPVSSLFVWHRVTSSHADLTQTLHSSTQRSTNPHPSFPRPNYNYEITLTNKQHTHIIGALLLYCPNFEGLRRH